jgi:hypothetical protein
VGLACNAECPQDGESRERSSPIHDLQGEGALMNSTLPGSRENLAVAVAREYRAPSPGGLRPRVTTATLLAALSLTASACALAGNTFFVTNNLDLGSGSLRDVIVEANLSINNTVKFDASLKGSTITLATGITITEPMTITGPGTNLLTISGSHLTRIFYANTNSANEYVNISDMTLTAGNAGGFSGGAIACSHCNLHLINMDINSSSAYYGGGVFIYDANFSAYFSRFSVNNGVRDNFRHRQ